MPSSNDISVASPSVSSAAGRPAQRARAALNLLRAHVQAHGATTIPDRQRKLANQMAAAAAEIENSLSGFNRERREVRHAPRDALGTLGNLALPQTDIAAVIQGRLL